MIQIIKQSTHTHLEWGFSLKVNGKFVRYSGIPGDAISVSDSKNSATIFANLSALREIWHLYQPTILHLVNSN